MQQVDYSELFKSVGMSQSGTVLISEQMSGLESNPLDDWLFLGVSAFVGHSAATKRNITSAAIIGSGNGIDAIAIISLYPHLNTLYVSDILSDILPTIEKNINSNVPIGSQVKINMLAGRDCEPLPQKVDLIYGNLPLVLVEEELMQQELATTTLASKSSYAHLTLSEGDPLLDYSMLSQLGFLISAKQKLASSGSIITLIGGRVPDSVVEKCFQRAGLRFERLLMSFMLQSDAQFLKEYAEYEDKTKGVQFEFYNSQQAHRLLEIYNVPVRGKIVGLEPEQLRDILYDARISASEAFSHYQQGKSVGHLAFAYEAYI